MKNITILELLSSPHLEDHIIHTDLGYNAFIEFKPYNINILKENDKEIYLSNFAHMIFSLNQVSFICTDIKQNYKENISYLKSQIEKEDNQKIKNLLINDYEYISGYYGNLPFKSIFLIQIFDKKYDNLQLKIHGAIKILSGYNIDYELLSKEDVKNIVAKQFNYNVNKEGYDEYEGERAINYWAKRN